MSQALMVAAHVRIETLLFNMIVMKLSIFWAVQEHFCGLFCLIFNLIFNKHKKTKQLIN